MNRRDLFKRLGGAAGLVLSADLLKADAVLAAENQRRVAAVARPTLLDAFDLGRRVRIRRHFNRADGTRWTEDTFTFTVTSLRLVAQNQLGDATTRLNVGGRADDGRTFDLSLNPSQAVVAEDGSVIWAPWGGDMMPAMIAGLVP